MEIKTQKLILGVIYLKREKLEMSMWGNGEKTREEGGWGLTGNLEEEEGVGGK